MNRDDPPTTITGLLTGEDQRPFKPRFVRAVLRCAFLAAPMFVQMREREPEIIAHNKRVAKRGTKKEQPVAAASTLPATAGAPLLSTTDAPPVDAATLGAVRAEDLGPRNQPHRSTRSERRKDGR